jgi:hypothetical protein
MSSILLTFAEEYQKYCNDIYNGKEVQNNIQKRLEKSHSYINGYFGDKQKYVIGKIGVLEIMTMICGLKCSEKFYNSNIYNDIKKIIDIRHSQAHNGSSHYTMKDFEKMDIINKAQKFLRITSKKIIQHIGRRVNPIKYIQ